MKGALIPDGASPLIGGFMGVGAYACYKLTTYFPDVNIIVLILLSGLFSAAIGVLFGLPSLRIKGFYLAVATLAATPSVNVTPSMTKGNWFAPFRRRHVLAAA